MKFVVESVSAGAARCGRLTKSEHVSLKTPGYLHYTRASAVPYLTREVFNYLTFGETTSEPPSFGYALSVDSTYHMLPAVQAANDAAKGGAGTAGGIAKFASLPNGPATTFTYLAVKNAGELCPSGHHEQETLPVWTRYGKRTLTTVQYMDYVEAFRPDMFVTLCDGDTNAESSRKRALKSADRSERFFEECLTKYRTSDVLRGRSMLLAPIEGGYIARTREVTIQNLQKHHADIGGYVLDGFHNNGGTATLLSATELNDLVTSCITVLPADKLRCMFGAYNPATVLQLCATGVDLFDNSYAYLATKNACALTFALDEEENVEGEALGEKTESDPAFDRDLADERYKTDFAPLRRGCTCLACTKHTRAYVHHLVKTNELLASILLMIHNVHHYDQFFNRIRARIADNTLQQLIALIDQQTASPATLSHLETKLRVVPEKPIGKTRYSGDQQSIGESGLEVIAT